MDATRLPAAVSAAATAAPLTEWRILMNDVVPRGKPDQPAKVENGAGAVLLHARHAKIHGTKLRYEPEPHKDTLGFWTQKDDWAEWEFDVPSAGTFEVQVLQGCGTGSGGAEVEVAVADQSLLLKVEETGHFQRFVPRTLGTVKLDKAGRYTLIIKPRSKPGAAVMDICRIVLRAAP